MIFLVTHTLLFEPGTSLQADAMTTTSHPRRQGFAKI
jgi:hypothetical protein